jgi:hypothetical protein
MNVHEISSIMAAIVGVAMVTTIVAHPGTAGVIRASGDAFSGSIRAALGK